MSDESFEKATDAVLTWVTSLDTNEDRLQVIRAIAAEVCLHCGGLDSPCPCMRDE